MIAPASPSICRKSADELSSTDTIAETRALIRDIEGAQMHPQKKRRLLFKARRRLAELKAAADRGAA
jgi:hypothetical protein